MALQRIDTAPNPVDVYRKVDWAVLRPAVGHCVQESSLVMDQVYCREQEEFTELWSYLQNRWELPQCTGVFLQDCLTVCISLETIHIVDTLPG